MKAILRVVRRTEYLKTLEMSPEDFEAYQKALDSNKNCRSAKKQLNGLITEEDWADDEIMDIDLEEVRDE